MPNRLRLYDIRISDMPQLVGLCSGDQRGVANMVNRAQERLLYAKEAGEDSWWGTWAEIAFTVQCGGTNPYITLPREVARLELATLCDRPVVINNQFQEYLQFGNGRMPKQFGSRWNGRCIPQAYTRNNVPTFVDLTSPPQYLVVYLTDPSDNGRRVLLQGLDNNNQVIYTQDAFENVTGEWVTLDSTKPFVAAVNQFNSITGIQKDLTVGPVRIYQMDVTTGAQVLLLTMEPTEEVASYRRYFFHPLPFSCCPSRSATTPQPLVVTAIAKLELMKLYADTDYLLIQSAEAITAECECIRLGSVDTIAAKSQAAERHTAAIRMLNGQLTHYLGLNNPALVFAPFGSARLERQRIGTMI
jgi:hypothetical protein